jgi:nitroimidazol reductase NimA-like FMN-containing flavoprotein (pyridoxamine 5'-phosphate oxidase superfamily)
VRDDRRRDLTDVECHKLLAERYLGRLALANPRRAAVEERQLRETH